MNDDNRAGRNNITPGRIRDLTTTKSQAFLWDKTQRQLAVRVTSTGAKSFIFQSPLKGKDIRITIGKTDDWTLEDARKEARRLQAMIDSGKDPREAKREVEAEDSAKREEALRQKEAARKEDVVVADAWAVYIEARRRREGQAKHIKRWGERHLQDHLDAARCGDIARVRGTGTLKPGPLCALMQLKLKDLTEDTVRAWLDKETAIRPTKAALAYRLLRAFLRWCATQKDYADTVHIESVSPTIARDCVPRPQVKGADCLQKEQLGAWFKAVRSIHIPTVSAYLQALLLTGRRREELALLKWDDVSFEWQSMRLRDKVEGSSVLPLTPYIGSLLLALPRRNEWVFSSDAQNSTTGRIADVRYPHVKALEMAGLPHVSLHGLRRSFSSLAEWSEVPSGAIAQLQGHQPSALAEKHYKRRPLDMLRMFHTRIEAWFLEQAGIPQPSAIQEGLRLVKAA